MASISWFSCLHIRPTTASASDKGLSSPITVEHHKTTRPQLLSSLEEGLTVNRRQLILYTGTAAIAAPSTVSNALALNDVSEDFSIYTDDENKFKIEIPQGELNWKFVLELVCK
ncbi:PsbP domain-containing protein [Trifolium medium]|uniref:PsbP domain-containing protein n=1 Tax=Trifolium medium TaxID=97028 RepID=A0A392PAF2_9FABA|nr:PsbP domain-containing protein [Trifolium medium]